MNSFMMFAFSFLPSLVYDSYSFSSFMHGIFIPSYSIIVFADSLVVSDHMSPFGFLFSRSPSASISIPFISRG